MKYSHFFLKILFFIGSFFISVPASAFCSPEPLERIGSFLCGKYNDSSDLLKQLKNNFSSYFKKTVNDFETNLIQNAAAPLNNTVQKNIITLTGGIIAALGIYNTTKKETRTQGVIQTSLGMVMMYSACPIIEKINQPST